MLNIAVSVFQTTLFVRLVYFSPLGLVYFRPLRLVYLRPLGLVYFRPLRLGYSRPLGLVYFGPLGLGYFWVNRDRAVARLLGGLVCDLWSSATLVRMVVCSRPAAAAAGYSYLTDPPMALPIE